MARKKDICYLEDTSVEALANALQTFERANKKTVFIFASAANNYQQHELSPVLQSQTLSVFGGVFPSVVLGGKLYETGTVLIAFEERMPITIYNNISEEIDKAITGTTTDIDKNASLIILVDALREGMENFLEQLYQNLGSGLQIIGGAAGSPDLIPKPCLFSNQGFIEDAAVVATLPNKLTAVTGHGWEILDGPYVITESHGHDIISINYKPAFEIYQEAILNLSGTQITEDNFFTVSKSYPLGIAELSGDLLVRDPGGTKAGSISCFGNMPQNSTVYILRGDAKKLIDTALEKSKEVLSESDNSNKTVLLFDCFGRQMYLGKQANDELNGIENHLDTHTSVVGAFSLGEIANRHGGPMQLMNNSFAIGSF